MVDENIEQVEVKDETVDELDKVGPRDHGRMFSVGQFKVWRKNLMGNLNGVLQTFQKDVVGSQVRINLAWNAMNAVIRALTNKGLITEADIKEAGVELMTEARANIAKAKDAVALGRTLQRGEAQPTPIEKCRDDVNEALAKKKED